MATAVVVGTVIGTGVFRKPHEIAGYVGSTGPAALVWVLAGLLALLGSLAYAEVAVLFPRAGGNYVFLREGYGRPVGFLWGWVEFWIIRGASLAALATAFADSLHDLLREAAGRPGDVLLGPWQLKLVTVGVILALALINVRGVRWGGGFQTLITAVKVGSLVAILLLPFLVLLLAPAGTEAAPRVENLSPVLPQRWSLGLLTSFGAALLGGMWAYHGWMNVAWLAEEVKQPQRNLPLALLAGTGLLILLYLGANLAYFLTLSQAELAMDQNKVVVAAFGQRLLGSVGVAAASAVLMCSVFGALSGNLLVGPRLLYAMAEDGLAPRALGAVHPRFHTPVLAILVLSGWAALLVVAVGILTEKGLLDPTTDHFDVLTTFAMFGSVVFDTMAVTTIFVFRRRLPHAERPYRCWGYPVVPTLYVLILTFVLVSIFTEKPGEALTGVGFIAAGLIVYLLLFRGTRPPGERAG
jgi:amino acid transporter